MRPARCQNVTSMKFWRGWRLHNKAADGSHDKNYYRLLYQTVREKVDSWKHHFKDLVMRWLGDKDHKKVLNILCEVDKSNLKKSREREDRGAGVARSSRPFNMRFYFCNKRGHRRLTALIESPVIPNRLPNQTSRLCSDRTGVIRVVRHLGKTACCNNTFSQ